MCWHDERFKENPAKHKRECLLCGRAYWLPRSKVDLYMTCGGECAAKYRDMIANKRKRVCECGNEFIPRPGQLAAGQGRFCSNKCALKEVQISAHTEQANQKRTDTIRLMHANGLIKVRRGIENPSWTGGQIEARRRSIASGKSAKRLREYRKKNKCKVREWSQKRRNGNTKRLPRGTIQSIGLMQKWKCAICTVSVRELYHLDHIMPLKLGGKHEPLNLQLLCPTCNVRKSAKHPVDYMQERGFLI